MMCKRQPPGFSMNCDVRLKLLVFGRISRRLDILPVFELGGKSISVSPRLSRNAATTATWLAICLAAQAGETALPVDVGSFIGRRANCQQWSGKAIEPSQAEMMRVLKCDDIKADEQALRSNYANNPGAIAALNATWIKVVQRVAVPASRLPGRPNPDE